MINLNEPTADLIPFTDAQRGVLTSRAENLLVNSVAGSGKSKLLAQLAFDYSAKSVLYLAFNKEIVEDIRQTLPSSCDCSTIHAYGLSLIRANQKRMKIDFYKYGRDEVYFARHLVNNLIGFHQSTLGLDSIESMHKTADRFMLSSKFLPEAFAAWQSKRHNHEIISAGDMISVPLEMGYVGKHYDLVLIDEAADLSADKLALIRTIDTDRLVFCSDRDQAIYSFLGSDPDIISNIISELNPELHSCNQTFRCPEQVTELAAVHVPEFFTEKPGGSIKELHANEMSSSDYEEDALIICRANAPLMNIASRFIKAGRDFRIKQRRIAILKRAINAAIKKASVHTQEGISDSLRNEHRKKVSKFKKNKWPLDHLQDELECQLSIVNFGSSVKEASNYLKRLALATTSGPRLSTAHSGKGLQSENLYLLKPDIGLSIARRCRTKQDEDVERRMIPYVSITRSLNKLTFLT